MRRRRMGTGDEGGGGKGEFYHTFLKHTLTGFFQPTPNSSINF